MNNLPVRILYIDLEKKTFNFKVHEDLSQYLGGVGLTTALLSEELDHDSFVLAKGPFCGLFPGCGMVFASFVSPLSQNLGESLVGGNLGVNFGRIGVEGVVVSGKSKSPVVLRLSEDGVEFLPGEDLWGKTPLAASRYLLGEGDSERTSVLTIGPAAEKGLRFGNIFAGFGHWFGTGLGSVWGRKKLKALVVRGERETVPPRNERFERVRLELEEKFAADSHAERPYGVPERSKAFCGLLEKSGSLWAENFRRRAFPRTTLIQKFFDSAPLSRCSGCPLECPSYSCADLVSLGPLLGIEEKEEIFSLISLTRDFGMDPVSVGAVLSWLTEKEGWEFGDAQSYQALILALAERKESWAKSLSLGIARAASGESSKFAFDFSGNLGLPFLCGHLSLLSRFLSPAGLLWLEPACLLDLTLFDENISDEEALHTLISGEERALLRFTLSCCPRFSQIYKLPVIFSGLESIGAGVSHDDLEKLPETIYNLRWTIRERIGFSWEEIRVPDRIFELDSATGRLSKEKFRVLVNLFREILEQRGLEISA